jgi:putative transcriptional regulator
MIIVNIDVMLARRKMRSKQLAALVGITEANMSLLKSNKVKGIRFDTLDRICAALGCQPGDLLEYRDDADASSGEAPAVLPHPAARG